MLCRGTACKCVKGFLLREPRVVSLARNGNHVGGGESSRMLMLDNVAHRRAQAVCRSVEVKGPHAGEEYIDFFFTMQLSIEVMYMKNE